MQELYPLIRLDRNRLSTCTHIINYMSDLLEIDRIDYFIVPILFVSVKVFGLAAVPRV